MNEHEKDSDGGKNVSAIIPVVDETVSVGKQVVDKGSIRFQKHVEEHAVQVPFVSRYTEYSVERVPVNQYVEMAPGSVRYEGNTMIVSVLEEEVVVRKRLKVVEELRITPIEKEKKEEIEVKLRRERVDVIRGPDESRE